MPNGLPVKSYGAIIETLGARKEESAEPSCQRCQDLKTFDDASEDIHYL